MPTLKRTPTPELRQTVRVPDAESAGRAKASDSLLRDDDDGGWWDLVQSVPAGFDVYVSIAFTPGPVGQRAPGGDHRIREALRTLARLTATPTEAYVATHERRPGPVIGDRATGGRMPHGTMLVRTGPVEGLMLPAADSSGGGGRVYRSHLIWPADGAWCLSFAADDTEFTVGCAQDAAEALMVSLSGAARRVEYGG
jgi:hypothetical protein